MTAAPKPLQCKGPRDGSTGPFGNEGRRRCRNMATHALQPISAAGHRMARIPVCDEHLPTGALGVNRPTGWEIRFGPLSDRDDTNWTVV